MSLPDMIVAANVPLPTAEDLLAEARRMLLASMREGERLKRWREATIPLEVVSAGVIGAPDPLQGAWIWPCEAEPLHSDWTGIDRRLAMAKLCATKGDQVGISAEQAHAALAPPEIPVVTVPLRQAKPAITGLGVVAKGDHRPGLWKPLE